MLEEARRSVDQVLPPVDEGVGGLQCALVRRLHQGGGVKIHVEVVAPGGLDALTGFGTVAKLIRFEDLR